MLVVQLKNEEMLFLCENVTLKIEIASYENGEAIFLRIEGERGDARKIPLYSFYGNLLSQNEMESLKLECQDKFFEYLKEGVCNGNVFVDLRKGKAYCIFDPIVRAIMGERY